LAARRVALDPAAVGPDGPSLRMPWSTIATSSPAQLTWNALAVPGCGCPGLCRQTDSPTMRMPWDCADRQTGQSQDADTQGLCKQTDRQSQDADALGLCRQTDRQDSPRMQMPRGCADRQTDRQTVPGCGCPGAVQTGGARQVGWEAASPERVGDVLRGKLAEQLEAHAGDGVQEPSRVKPEICICPHLAQHSVSVKAPSCCKARWDRSSKMAPLTMRPLPWLALQEK
jgi:hypothetical protein